MSKRVREEIEYYLGPLVARLMIWCLRAGYGADCETKDTDDFPELNWKLSDQGRCGSCEAREVIDWLKKGYDL